MPMPSKSRVTLNSPSISAVRSSPARTPVEKSSSISVLQARNVSFPRHSVGHPQAVPSHLVSKRAQTGDLSAGSQDLTVKSVPGIFSKAQTVIASSNTSVTTISRDSIASFDGLAQGDRKGGLSALEAQAKQMKYVRIEFSDDQGSSTHPPRSTRR